ncbi:hypothetical protein [Devosia elaeis]|uniref:hypothetical protein n=1 Tax=Devosia elaeis TaxID=1770058 RepID=UPI000AFCFC28|nr:hypothetical protein [Devosia elaeis]
MNAWFFLAALTGLIALLGLRQSNSPQYDLSIDEDDDRDDLDEVPLAVDDLIDYTPHG